MSANASVERGLQAADADVSRRPSLRAFRIGAVCGVNAALRALVILWALLIGHWSFCEASAQQLFIEKSDASPAAIAGAVSPA